ncbi:C-type lectin domain family 2 member D2 [Orchesella cincta]|uniref:C-type lectin domain family 2 member D2 n=1 Tax=Orchesella cincta TaxID=48709 RepID=A0A1D2MBW6_ORCCI|nr:C-type lectin domain family 2 member D2 [Orchesella cincta]
MEFFLTLTIFSFVGISAAQHNMAYLGSINGKSYYADKTALNWTAANYLCRKYGLELATLNVKAEADFLKNAYIQHNIQDWHWVGAVDDYTKTFKWANTAARVETYSSLKMYPRGSESVGEKCLTYRYLETPG